jgi:phosphoglycerate kinase
MELKKLSDLTADDLKGKKVVLRTDFNVDFDYSSGQAKIVDDTRIKAGVPTIKFLLDNGATISILTHVGRPDGKVVEELRTAPIEKRLKELIDGDYEVEENLRFDPGEEANDETFAQKLSLGHDLFVNDAFASSHRAHASIVGIPKILPSYAGLLMEKEVNELSAALTPPQGSIAIIGGSKFETKIPLLAKLLATYSTILLGGALGNDIIKARGMPFGASLSLKRRHR